MAEKAIQTFMDHFVSVLSGFAPTFPLHLWCQLLPQVEQQLLLLQQSRLHPNLSAYAHVYGHHDYNKYPFVPIGMDALVHNKPHKHQTYAEHCKKSFVLGTSTKHYRCLKFWSTATQATQILGAVFFKHKYLTNPSVTPEDLVIAAAKNLAQALKTSIPQHLQVSTIQAIQDLSEVFTDAFHKYSNDPTSHMPDTPPLGAYGVSKGVTHSPWLTISKGAHHYNFSNSTWHPTYLPTLQYPEISVPPRRVQCGSMAEHCQAATRDCTQVSYKF
jgi:hypothetical protein